MVILITDVQKRCRPRKTTQMGQEFAQKSEKSRRERFFWLVDGAYAPERVEGEPREFVKPGTLGQKSKGSQQEHPSETTLRPAPVTTWLTQARKRLRGTRSPQKASNKIARLA